MYVITVVRVLGLDERLCMVRLGILGTNPPAITVVGIDPLHQSHQST